MYIILYSQCTQFFYEFTQVCIFNGQNLSILYIQRTQYFIVNIHNFSKNVHNSEHSMCTIFQRMNIILYILHIHFFKECTQFHTLNVHNFQCLCTLSYIQYTQFFNVVNSSYTKFQRIYNILYI